MPLSQRFIGALWHNRLLFLTHFIHHYLPQRRGAALISASRDGAWLAKLVTRFGFEVVRGSSSRLGAIAMRQLAEVIRGGADAVITPDGPRGPAYQIDDGIIFLAQQTGAQVVPVNMEYSSCWRLRSWDRFILAKPFSRVRVIIGKPVAITATTTAEEFAAERGRLQAAMMALVEMR